MDLYYREDAYKGCNLVIEDPIVRETIYHSVRESLTEWVAMLEGFDKPSLLLCRDLILYLRKELWRVDRETSEELEHRLNAVLWFLIDAGSPYFFSTVETSLPRLEGEALQPLFVQDLIKT